MSKNRKEPTAGIQLQIIANNEYLLYKASSGTPRDQVRPYEYDDDEIQGIGKWRRAAAKEIILTETECNDQAKTFLQFIHNP